MAGLFVAFKEEFEKNIDAINQDMVEYTHKAARGECAWICSDCCCTFEEGMPDKCAHDHQGCTDIIIRDKELAKNDNNNQPTTNS